MQVVGGPPHTLEDMLLSLAAEPDLGGIAGWAVDLMERLGAPGAGVAIAIENLFPPLPSEIILPLAGFAAAQGTFSLASALFWTTTGSVVGATALYWIGRILGRERTRALIKAVPLVDVADADRTEAWFERHGKKAVFFGRMIPLFRSLISVPAGVTGMSLPLFLALTVTGSLIWNTIFILAGYALGDNWARVAPYADAFQLLVIVAVVAAVVVFVVKRVRRIRAYRRRVAAGEETRGGM